ncbi:MAG TPA: S53 family peptidase [Bryobacteraceae bacterium]|nr:S53 family peptidase [Bryobacteraceae bacterium]
MLALCLGLASVTAQTPRAIEDNLHPLARPEFDRGVVEPSMQFGYLSLTLKRSDNQQADLDQLLADQQDVASARYHHWLTPEQFGERFGATPADVDALVAWLQSSGFTVNRVARGGASILFRGTAAQVAQALHTEIHRYQVDGEMHYANAAAPQIPEALAGLVEGIRGLDDFHPTPAHGPSAWPAEKIAGVPPSPNWYSQKYPSVNMLAPADLAAIYNINALYEQGIDGSGQLIAIAGESDIDLADIEYFRQAFGLSFNDPQQILVPGSADPGVNNTMGEADLDLEWAGAVAPNATLVYVYAPNVLEAVAYAIDQALAPVLSLSFSICELRTPPSGAKFLATYGQQAAAEGMTWLAASGDAGAAACENQNSPFMTSVTRANVNLPASLPWVTGVGGSEFNEGNGSYWGGAGSDHGSARSYIPETGWNDETFINQNLDTGSFASSGGGASWLFSKPSWQAGPGVPDDGARDVPDVALTASWVHDPFALVSGGYFQPNGGTSAATPAFAGIVSLLNQYLVAAGAQSSPGLGNINPGLYALAQTAPSAFHDITSGSNIVPCVINSTQDCTSGSFGYNAGPGYDLVTGLGSVDAYALARAWLAAIGSPQLVITQATASNKVREGGPFR